MTTRQGKYSNQLILSLIGFNLLELKKIRLRLKSNIPIDGGSWLFCCPWRSLLTQEDQASYDLHHPSLFCQLMLIFRWAKEWKKIIKSHWTSYPPNKVIFYSCCKWSLVFLRHSSNYQFPTSWLRNILSITSGVTSILGRNAIIQWCATRHTDIGETIH